MHVYLREPVKGECGIEEVNGSGREEPAVEWARDPGSEVGAVAVGGQALLHAAAVVGE